MRSEIIPVAREGYPFIGYSGFLTIVAGLVGAPLVCLFLAAVTTFMLLFFRDPERLPPAVDRGVLAPADGRIIAVERTVDRRFGPDETLRISIFMNVFNVHVNRIPFPGTVVDIRHVPGSFLAADTDKALLHNEYCAVTLATEHDRRITVVQVAGLVARRIVCRLEVGDSVAAAQRYGLIRFGSRVDLYLPPGTNPVVAVGDKVSAGETLLAYLG